MFAKTIIDSDAFLEMPVTSQLLYFHLSMRADDDGFINKPKAIMKMIGANDDDLKILFLKKFVIPFESGVVVIKHWRINNYIRQDTYHKTPYQEEMNLLELDENNAYTLRERDEITTQIRLDKNRLDKNSIDKSIRHKHGTYNNVLLTDEELEKLKNEIPNYQVYIEKVSEYCASTGKSYKNYLATIRNWHRRDNTKEDKLPTYDSSKNVGVSKKDEQELLEIMGKE